MPVYFIYSKVHAGPFKADDLETVMLRFKMAFPEEKIIYVEQYFPDSQRSQRGWRAVFRAEDEK